MLLSYTFTSPLDVLLSVRGRVLLSHLGQSGPEEPKALLRVDVSIYLNGHCHSTLSPLVLSPPSTRDGWN